ncbi:MAG: glycoside hydrolase family 3 C-terminal domain-containing protein [Salinivirgaceae bacterium]
MRTKGIITLLMTVFFSHLIAQDKTLLPYQDTKLSIDERVDDLVSRMTLQEKAFQLFNAAPAIDRLGVPAYNWWNECLHGVARAGKASVFPQAIGMAAAFDENLMLRIGTAVSDEARAKHHYFARNGVRGIYMGLTFWTPNINIFRDPRWGRGQETYGEDPYLTGRIAVNYINGLQGNDPKYFKTIATAKHYAVHSGPEFSRHTDNFSVNDRDLYDTYLPAFKATVQESNVQSVMCAYNRFRDKPCCGSDLLMNNILRNQFKFNGYVVSDCGAISDFYQKNSHNMVETPSQAWGWAISAGTDLNCEGDQAFVQDNFDEAVRTGVINEKDINVSVKRLFKARFMLGMFDPEDQQPYTKIPMSAVGSKEHLDLTLEAAEKSLVLLKNNGILPLKNVTKVALIGPNANNFSILIGNYNGDPINPITPLKALKERLGSENVIYTPGCPIVPGVFTDFEIVGKANFFHSENGKTVKGLLAEYYQDGDLKGTPKIVRTDKNIDFVWELSPINKVIEESFSVKWTGLLVPVKSGKYSFNGNVQVKINGIPLNGNAIDLEKGKQYQFEATLKVVPNSWSNSMTQQYANLSWMNTDDDYRQEALDAAANADVIVFCGGISANLEGEEMPLEIDGFTHGDRTHINLPQIQEDLLKELHKTSKPIVYVNFSGSAIAMNWENENLPAIVQAFYPGEATGTALTRLLFGNFNPSGRLPITFYKSVEQLPDFKNYEMEGRTYRYFKGEPLYPFGFGLSYTTFGYSNLQANETNETQSPLTVTVDVKNTGTTDGEEVVQLYVSHKTATSIVPVISLKGFQRVSLKKGEQKTVTFTLNPDDFALTNIDSKQVVEPGTYEIAIGGSSDAKKLLVKKVVLTGTVVEIK